MAIIKILIKKQLKIKKSPSRPCGLKDDRAEQGGKRLITLKAFKGSHVKK